MALYGKNRQESPHRNSVDDVRGRSLHFLDFTDNLSLPQG